MKQKIGIILVLAMLIVMPTAVSATITRVEETDASFVWSDNWESQKNLGASGGMWKVTPPSGASPTPGAKVDITFTGTGITLISLKGPNCGIANVEIDGVSYPNIDMYSPDVAVQVEKVIDTDLINAQHVLTITVSGTKNHASGDNVLVIDAVDITTPTPMPTPTPSPSLAPTPAPTLSPTLTSTPVITPTLTPTPAPAGFEVIFAIAGLLAVAYLLRRRG